MGPKRDPLQFAYVHLHLTEEEDERPELFKVYHVDDLRVKLRHVAFTGGEEVEYDAWWVPWRAIMTLREVNRGNQ